MILKYLARASARRDELYGADALTACQVRPVISRNAEGTCVLAGPLHSALARAYPRPQVDTWLETAAGVVTGSALEGQCSALNDYLQLRTFLVGYCLTAADLALWGQLQGAPERAMRWADALLVHWLLCAGR
jgi:glutamyl-tRNA synthetase